MSVHPVYQKNIATRNVFWAQNISKMRSPRLPSWIRDRGGKREEVKGGEGRGKKGGEGREGKGKTPKQKVWLRPWEESRDILVMWHTERCQWWQRSADADMAAAAAEAVADTAADHSWPYFDNVRYQQQLVYSRRTCDSVHSTPISSQSSAVQCFVSASTVSFRHIQQFFGVKNCKAKIIISCYSPIRKVNWHHGHRYRSGLLNWW